MLLGWVLLAFAVVGMARIASSEGRSALLWGAITALICFLCLRFIPLALLNIAIACAISFTIMLAANIIQKR